ncbi:protein misato [Tribolium castaneum]|uniref:Protein misato-like Protein n=1 Tax=Tribolium castaneum TaxID=7070 RepID=D2A4U9_TRICA|nr:PREDICTED: protein misato [Tribolium castaneum]EFA05270.1 Protein misato-like Protein [Tribolium castaneum]|eukprot:XP_972672.1 PREDICTED: protein misato [Tribolium castaneum]
MSAHEILTLQFGHYSNYVGAHWWNVQEAGFRYDSPSEINHDVLFREGVTLKNEVTFTPRLLLVDLKGSLKTLPQEGELYSLPSQSAPDQVEIIAQPPEEKNEFQKDIETNATLTKIYDLERQVRVWSDFLYTRFHPRTVNTVQEYQHDNENTPFDIFPLGANLWKKDQFSEDFSDKIRNYIEECNSFQGFHILCDSTDAFAGITVSCLEHLNDDYDTKPVLGFPLVQPSTNPIHLLNLALCFDGFAEHSSLFVPLTSKPPQFNYIAPNPDLKYHTSAILAATLDTLSLNYRLKSAKNTLIDVCSDFATNGRKVATASVCLPFPLKTNEDFIDCLNTWEGHLSQSVTPWCDINPDNSLQLVVLRGIPERRLKKPPNLAEKQRNYPAYRCNDLKEMLSYFIVCTSYGTKSEVTVCGEQMAVKTPFPGFFTERVGNTGDIDGGRSGPVEKINTLAGLHTGKFVGTMLETLSQELEKIKYKKYHQFVSEGVENDQFRECFDRLLDLKDCYEDNYLI